MGVEHHRVAGPYLIVVRADAVREQQEHAVVVRPTREPAHEPRPALGPAQLRLARRGILMATGPDRGVDRLHAARAHRVTPARLVRREQDLGAQQRRGAGVLDDVVVVTDQHAHAATVRRVEHGVAVPGANVRVLEDVQLAMDRPARASNPARESLRTCQ